MMDNRRWSDVALLALCTVTAILIHGYHPAVEDASIYLPGIEKTLDPSLFPYNAEFFTSHAHMTLFPNLVAAFVRISHLPLDWALLALHVMTIFVLLLGCLKIGRFVFRSEIAAWGAVALIAGLLTIPVAGTRLYIFDEYLNPRSISVPTVLFLVLAAYQRRWVLCGLLAVFAGAVHPLMAAFGITFVVLSLLLAKIGEFKSPATSATALMLLPFGLSKPISNAYREVLQANSYFSIFNWAWYEWIGSLAPLVLLWFFHRLGRETSRPTLDRVSRDLTIFGLIFTVAAIIFSSSPRFSTLMLFQPMRAFHLIYILLFVISGGLLAEYALKDKAWRWLVLFLPLCGGMYYKQQDIFSNSHHLELPGRSPSNDWDEAFRWVRANTPKNAYFALDPKHMKMPGEDEHGFRAIAERSMLADSVKDESAMSMFPVMAETWKKQADAQHDWRRFGPSDFKRLKASFGVDWVIVVKIQTAGLYCQHQNSTLAVCRVE